MSDKPTAKELGIGCGLVLLTMPLAVLWWAYAATKLWAWYAPFPPIGLARAYGLSLLIGMYTWKAAQKKDESETFWDNVREYFVIGLLRPAVALGLGYAVHLLWGS